MAVRIFFDDKPAGITLLTPMSAREYIQRHPPALRRRLSWRIDRRKAANGRGNR